MEETATSGYMQLSLNNTRASGGGAGRHRRHSREPICFEPRDRCNGVYLSLLLCGAGFLLPYNSFIVAVDYYHGKFPGSTIVYDMSMTYIGCAFFAVLTSNLLVDKLHLQTRITFGYVIAFVVLLLVALCDVWLNLVQHSFAYITTLVAVALVAFAATVQQSSFYGYTGMLPPRYTQAVMTGESAAGLIVSINRILTKLFLPGSATFNTLLFFLLSASMLLLCFVLFHVTKHSNFVRYHLNMCKIAKLPEAERGFANPLHEEVSLVDILDGQGTHAVNHNYGVLRMNSCGSLSQDGSSVTSPRATTQQEYTYTAPSDDSLEEIPAITFDNALASPQRRDVTNRAATTTRQPSFSRARTWLRRMRRQLSAWARQRADTFTKIKLYMWCMFLTYAVTLSLFPGIESDIVSCDLGTWMPVIVMAVFNAFDFLGKIIASIRYLWRRRLMTYTPVLRILLVPLLAKGAFYSQQTADTMPARYVHLEAFAITLTAILGVTNGFCGSLPMIRAPTKVKESKREIAGNMMMLAYSVGLVVGSSFSYVIHDFEPITGHHPCQLTHALNASTAASNTSISFNATSTATSAITQGHIVTSSSFMTTPFSTSPPLPPSSTSLSSTMTTSLKLMTSPLPDTTPLISTTASTASAQTLSPPTDLPPATVHDVISTASNSSSPVDATPEALTSTVSDASVPNNKNEPLLNTTAAAVVAR